MASLETRRLIRQLCSLKVFSSILAWCILLARTTIASMKECRDQNMRAFPQRGYSLRTKGLLRELNPGPLAPEARIIPLDQAASCIFFALTSHLGWWESSAAHFKPRFEMGPWGCAHIRWDAWGVVDLLWKCMISV